MATWSGEKSGLDADAVDPQTSVEDRKETTMRVFVAGATGAVGRPLIPQLIAAGHEVTATTRSPAKAEQLRVLGAKAVVLDGLDSMAMAKAVAVAEPDAIVHQMTAL